MRAFTAIPHRAPWPVAVSISGGYCIVRSVGCWDLDVRNMPAPVLLWEGAPEFIGPRYRFLLLHYGDVEQLLALLHLHHVAEQLGVQEVAHRADAGLVGLEDVQDHHLVGLVQGLEKLVSIGGMLQLRRTSQTNFEGLDSLVSLGSILTADNEFLQNFSGLENIT